MCDAIGNPTNFFLTPGNAHDLEGVKALIPGLKSDALLADKAYYAEERVLSKLDQMGVTPVISAKSNIKSPRSYDKHLYKPYLVENFFEKLRQYRAIATRYNKKAINFLGAIFLASCVILLK
ncbi:transposase [Candidatus Uabimicrobium sp. HlEnr_7]|uniref:transposase n=1 Tax=Candidatus Uabimicrobium helgolandensis TaxID=3095367 RepID=UPI003558A192